MPRRDRRRDGRLQTRIGGPRHGDQPAAVQPQRAAVAGQQLRRGRVRMEQRPIGTEQKHRLSETVQCRIHRVGGLSRLPELSLPLQRPDDMPPDRLEARDVAGREGAAINGSVGREHADAVRILEKDHRYAVPKTEWPVEVAIRLGGTDRLERQRPAVEIQTAARHVRRCREPRVAFAVVGEIGRDTRLRETVRRHRVKPSRLRGEHGVEHGGHLRAYRADDAVDDLIPKLGTLGRLVDEMRQLVVHPTVP